MHSDHKAARAWELYLSTLLALFKGERPRGRGGVRQRLMSRLRDMKVQGQPAIDFADQVYAHYDRAVAELGHIEQQGHNILTDGNFEPVAFEPFLMNPEAQERMAWITEGQTA